MKKLVFILNFVFLGSSLICNGQEEQTFDIVSYSLPSGWIKETGEGYVSHTVTDPATGEYARIQVFKSLPATGNINDDFDAEWNELVQPNYHPGNLTSTAIADYKEGWVSKIGVAPFRYRDADQVVILLTLVKGKTKMSYVFVSNTVAYQSVFEDFGSSLDFGTRADNNVPQNISTQPESQVAVASKTAATKTDQQWGQAVSQTAEYQFTTSNFDDGWTATIQNDCVLLERGNARIYLYFVVPYNADNFSGTGVMDRDYYWDNFVARQFKATSKQYNDAGEYVSSMKPKYVEGWGTEPETGADRFLAMALSVSPNAAQLTVASYPDVASFRQAFPKANDRFSSDLTAMGRYNKFAIGQSDFTGTWQSGGSQMTQWYDAITGAYAGATTASSSATFSFYTDSSYSSLQNGATGAVGAMNAFQQEYSGNNTVSNWNMLLTNRWQGKASNFDAHYQAVRGGRLLYLNNNAGEEYLLVRIK